MSEIQKHSRVWLRMDPIYEYVVKEIYGDLIEIQRMTPDVTLYFVATVHISQLEFII